MPSFWYRFGSIAVVAVSKYPYLVSVCVCQCTCVSIPSTCNYCNSVQVCSMFWNTKDTWGMCIPIIIMIPQQTWCLKLMAFFNCTPSIVFYLMAMVWLWPHNLYNIISMHTFSSFLLLRNRDVGCSKLLFYSYHVICVSNALEWDWATTRMWGC